jgi:hypothetical protein
MKIEMMIEGLNNALSESTIDALIDLQGYRSAGSAWCARNDPNCKYESMIVDDICRYFNKDVEVAAEKLSPDQYDKFYEKFDNNELDDYFPKLITILKDAKYDCYDL